VAITIDESNTIVKADIAYHGLVANITEVARRAGVSTTTAKRAIREPEKLAPETLRRVREAIEALDYEPDQLASALRSGRSSTLGLVIGSIVEPFFAELTRTIVHEVRGRGYSVIVADNEYRDDVEAAHLRSFYGNRVAGLILRSAYGSGNLDYVRRMQLRGVAVVEVDCFIPGSPLPHAMLDNVGAVDEGVRHLVAHGHRRIAALSSYHPQLNADERVLRFPETLVQHGLTLPAEYVSQIAPTEWDAHEATLRLMRLAEPPTALFATTGSMAAGAYRALMELGLRVPRDVSLLAFDDYPWMRLVDPGIDTLAQPVEVMGRAAVRLLFDQMRLGADAPVERLRFPAELIVRGSVVAPA
jgi:LacI family transcriptional regulator